MNKVTKKLVELAGAIPDSSGKWVPSESVEKLAHLMVEEFCAYVSTLQNNQQQITIDKILQHFSSKNT